jgi:hypothetical protein
MIKNMKKILNYKAFNENYLRQDVLDRILDKISERGIDALSNHEKTLLDNYAKDNFDAQQEIQKHINKYKEAKGVVKDLGLSVNEHPLTDDIGRYVVFKKGRGLIAQLGIIHEIVGVQKHWGHNEEGKYVFGIIGYRVAQVGKDNDFGRVGPVDKVEFVNMTEEEAIEKNKELNKKIEELYK